MRVPCSEPRRHPIGTPCVAEGSFARARRAAPFRPGRPRAGAFRCDSSRGPAAAALSCDGEHMNQCVIAS